MLKMFVLFFSTLGAILSRAVLGPAIADLLSIWLAYMEVKALVSVIVLAGLSAGGLIAALGLDPDTRNWVVLGLGTLGLLFGVPDEELVHFLKSIHRRSHSSSLEDLSTTTSRIKSAIAINEAISHPDDQIVFDPRILH